LILLNHEAIEQNSFETFKARTVNSIVAGKGVDGFFLLEAKLRWQTFDLIFD
jgi:hypothetical protein